MPSYLVTGVNRGLGWAFLRQISEDANNVVIGTVRDKASIEKKIADELGDRSNVHIVEAELLKYESIQASVTEVSKITGGKLDYIIANAAYISNLSAFSTFGELAETPQELEEDLLKSFKINVVGVVHLFNLYMPLILKGNVKKVITISTGFADLDLTNKYRVGVAGPYAISKGAVNVAVSKFHAQYAEDGVLFMGISPGVVDTGNNNDLDERQAKAAMELGAKFNDYAPGFRPLSPKESVLDVMKVIHGSSLENGRGGAFISHLGSKQWL
ncbi:hypothetical protein ACHAQA_003555 [Verticillium albo-atrum]